MNVQIKNPRQISVGSGFWKSFWMLCLHDRQPATGVVVMPVRMMAAIDIRKHCSRLIPD